MFLALVVPDAYAASLIPVAFVGLVSLVAFLFRQNARSNEALATVAQQVKDMTRRVDRIEDRVFWRSHPEPEPEPRR